MHFIFPQVYLDGMHDPEAEVPEAIVGKETLIFGNIQEIYDFHNKWGDVLKLNATNLFAIDI